MKDELQIFLRCFRYKILSTIEIRDNNYKNHTCKYRVQKEDGNSGRDILRPCDWTIMPAIPFDWLSKSACKLM